MGLCFKTTNWADSIWARHTERSSSAQRLVQEGVAKQNGEFEGFAADVHARLYLRNPPDKIEGDEPKWARELHAAIDELAEWRQLRARTQGDGFSSALAAEKLLEALLPKIPDPPPPDDQDKQQDPGGDPGGGGGTGGGQGPAGQPGGQPGKPGGQGGEDGGESLRRALRQAVAKAKESVDEAQAALEGVEDTLGLTRPGTGYAKPETLKDLDNVRSVYEVVRNSPGLKRIAELAGRLARLASSKRRTKVQPASGSVKGITLGGDVGKVLPQELAPLASGNKLLKLAALSKILRRRALSYLQEGDEPQQRGPIVVLVDESGSIRENGKDVWSKAVALALLTTATHQHRAWHLVGFNDGITHTHTFQPGDTDLSELTRAVLHRCFGGTDFEDPLNHACETIENEDTLKRADVVFITDGDIDKDLQPETVARVNDLRTRLGLSVYVIGLGHDFNPERLVPIADQIVHVNPNARGDDVVAPLLNLE